MKCCSTINLVILLTLIHLVVEVKSACANEKYYVRSEFRDKGCPSEDITFTKTVNSKTVCTKTCSNDSSCKCVSYNTADKTCIGCNGIYEVSNGLLDKPGHIFYELELYRDDCVNSGCLNGATCVDAVYAYTCTCAENWSGEFCDTRTINIGTGSQVGTEFITGFMSSGIHNNGIPNLIIVSSVAQSTNVNVTIPFLNISEQHVVDDVLYLNFSNSLLPAMDTEINQKAVQVTSDRPVTLFTENSLIKQIGCSLILPTSTLGLQYIVNVHDVTGSGLPQLLVTGTTDNTMVTVTLPSLPPINVQLNRYDVYQYRSTISQAGTLISADKPVAVKVGHSCANIPTKTDMYCEFMVTSVPPTETIGLVYIAPYQKDRSDYSIGVSARYDNTDVQFWNKNQDVISSYNLNSQESIFESFNSSKIIGITSNKKILVSQYGHSSDETFGGPSQMILPAVNQYTSSYEFSVSNFITVQSYISVVVNNTYGTEGLMLNGSPPFIVESHNFTVPGHGTFNVVYFSVEQGVKYTLNHDNLNATFAAMLYARNTRSEYTTSLGFEL